METPFEKYQGTGNDFIMIDDRTLSFPEEDTALVARLCERRFGIGADGLILLQPDAESDFYMRYYNSDGNVSSMCGNGGRCIAAFAYSLGVASRSMRFRAADGIHEAEVTGDFVRMTMQDVPSAEDRGNGIYVLNTGSPHYVVFPDRDLHSFDIVAAAREVRYNDEFKKEGINVNFVKREDNGTLRIRTYERGVEGETLSCGTGVTASALSFAIGANLPAGTHSIAIESEGGGLNVRFTWNPENRSFSGIWLEGPAQQVFTGTIDTAVHK